MTNGFERDMRIKLSEITEHLTELNKRVGVQNGRVTRNEQDIVALKQQIGTLPTGTQIALIVGQELDKREIQKKVQRYDAIVTGGRKTALKVLAYVATAGAGALLTWIVA